MADLGKVLIVGGGTAGMSTSIALAQRGYQVELIDLDPEWRVLGAGLTITGPTLRAFKSLGVINEVASQGYFSAKVKMFAGDGTQLGEAAMPQLEPDIPAAGGILRPDLHRILSERTRATGVEVRLGVSIESFNQDADGVTVRFTDGAEGRYGLVVGADGASSSIRRMLFPNTPELESTGQGCWRVLADRPSEVDSTEIYYGPGLKAGVNPCSPDKMYMFLVNQMDPDQRVEADIGIEMLRELLAPFGGTVAKVRDGLGPGSSFNYRPIQALLLPRPWSKGRVGLLGDAAHATSPHLASGAGLSVEDAVVFADELTKAPSVEVGLRNFEERRWERCKLVVETSVRLGQMELAGESNAEQARVMGEAVRALGMPI